MSILTENKADFSNLGGICDFRVEKPHPELLPVSILNRRPGNVVEIILQLSREFYTGMNGIYDV